MFGFMRIKDHEAAMAAKDAQIASGNSEILKLRCAPVHVNDVLVADNRSLLETNYALDRTAATCKRERDAARAERDAALAALVEIARMETPSCAHIGKRMAARALEALPGTFADLPSEVRSIVDGGCIPPASAGSSVNVN